MFTRILIVEDHADARAALAEVCGEAFPAAFIEQADCCATARDLIRRRCPDLALLDLGLPDGSGIDLIRLVQQCHPAAVPVVVTVFDDDARIFPALRAGAQGYLLKDQPPAVLVELLKGLALGIPAVSPRVVRAMLKHFTAQASADGGSDGGQAVTLTTREREVLVGIAQGHTVRAMAQQMNISINTVATHVKHIYAKLDVTGRVGAARVATQMGLITP